MDIFYALLPAIFWGSLVLVNVKIGGGPYTQTLGTTLGALLFSIGLYIYDPVHLDMKTIIIGLISGFFWVLGQGGQLKTIDVMGVSKTLPISTGMQLVATTLFGAFIFNEWNSGKSVTLGIIALVLIVTGVIFTSIKGKNEKDDGKGNLKKGIFILLVSTFGYLVYVVIVRLFGVDGWDVLLPQGIGMVIGGVVLTAKHKPFNTYALKNILPGLIWAAGNMFLFISQDKVGVATSFTLSQMSVVVATLGGIFILKEHKTKRQLVFISIGIILIIISAVLLGISKS
ncbi:RhaT/GlcU family sugar-proton symporter [Paenibacillus gallinarum]|uniref:Glucose transporter GlcU n=1 Tax=Paenibacillus gallinarum TaxID=2762232 RepID=A0ABR8SXX2_9BACL|nr:RhaT/GlcU family sugar-proton symporter [Paenibacillus gallinarum]MBD7968351.1 glucose transporter GlcU [Paenibacillus gallinarum]